MPKEEKEFSRKIWPFSKVCTMCSGSISHYRMMVRSRTPEFVPRLIYFSVVRHIWTIRAIPTYRVYLLNDRCPITT